MVNYKKMYLNLFNRITDAIEEIEKMNLGTAKDILIAAQQSAEEEYIGEEEEIKE